MLVATLVFVLLSVEKQLLITLVNALVDQTIAINIDHVDDLLLLYRLDFSQPVSIESSPSPVLLLQSKRARLFTLPASSLEHKKHLLIPGNFLL